MHEVKVRHSFENGERIFNKLPRSAAHTLLQHNSYQNRKRSAGEEVVVHK
jgi:hypothetical protein